MQGTVLDEQYDDLGIPKDIDNKAKSDECPNQQRTVILSNTQQIQARACEHDLQAKFEQDVSKWFQEKEKKKLLEDAFNAANQARMKQKKKKKCCFCEMEPSAILEEISKAQTDGVFAKITINVVMEV